VADICPATITELAEPFGITLTGIKKHVSVLEQAGLVVTRVTTSAIFHTAEERNGMLGSGMEGGMNETYQRFDELLARLAGN